MAQKTPDPAVAHLRAGTLWSGRRSSQITSDLRPTDSRLDTRRSCMDSCPIPAQLFSVSAGGRVIAMIAPWYWPLSEPSGPF
jgi:hypothetical protein